MIPHLRIVLGLAFAGLLTAALQNAALAQSDIDKPSRFLDEKHDTRHFRIIYRSQETSAAFAKTVGGYFERARDKIMNDMGYREPEMIRGEKLDVYIAEITRNGRPAPRVLGSTQYDRSMGESQLLDALIADPWIEINLERVLRDPADEPEEFEFKLKRTIAHEYFHVIQKAYDARERKWLNEAK